VRTGVLGGTFDPPHYGHLIAAQEAWSVLTLDRVLLVPAREPPHKDPAGLTAPELRLEMLYAAVAGDPRLAVSDIELRRDGPSFTVDTLRALRATEPGAELYLLLGADQYLELDTWRSAAEIRRLARIGVFARWGDDPAAGRVGVERVAMPRIDLSASAIRHRVAAGRPIRYLVPEAVERLIDEHGLYRGDPLGGEAAVGPGGGRPG
jgi:nicotinate-nucleotide adenylyltransferase